MAVEAAGLFELLRTAVADDPQIGEVKRAVAAAPNVRESLPRLGDALLARDRLREARAVFAYLGALDPADVATLKQLCRIDRRLGNTSQMLQHLRAIVAVEPKNIDALAELGGILNDAQMLGEAADIYRRILDLDERHAAAHLGLAWIARAERNQGLADAHFGSAILLYQEIVASNAGDTASRLQLASALRATGALDEAEMQFESLIGEGACLIAARLGLGWIAHARKNPVAALQHFRSAAETAPQNLHAGLAYARLLRETGNFAEAERQYRALEKRSPKHAEIQAALGTLAGKRGDWQSAASYLQAACKQAPGNIGFAIELARACSEAMDWPAAEAAYTEALAIDPACLEALVGLGEITKIRGHVSAAIAWFEKAAAAAPADLRPKTELRKLRTRNGEHDWRAEIQDALTVAQSPDADSSSQLEAATLLVEYGLTKHASGLLGRIKDNTHAVNKLMLATRQIERMGLEQTYDTGTEAMELDTLRGLIEKPIAGAETLLIVFGGTNNRLWMTFSLLHRLLQPSGVSLVYVRDLRRDWYRSGLEGLGHDFASSADALLALAKRHGARRLLTLGNCVGCYGALRFGLALGAEGVLALSPKLRPSDELKPDQKAVVSTIKTRLPDNHVNIHAFYAAAQMRPQVSIIYAEHCAGDAADAHYMADLPDIRIHAIPESSDPDSVKELLVRGLLAPVLSEFVATGTISAELCARIGSSAIASPE